MATLANNGDGTGYSRVFIAQDTDIEIPVLQDELNKKVSFIRVFNWQWPSKKGWCSAGGGWKNELDLTRSTWYYSWSADKATFPDYEYVPIRQSYSWPSWLLINEMEDATHILGYNEPDRPDQANMTVERAIEGWPSYMNSGLRIGVPAVASNTTWLRNFISECESRNYRIDYVPIHAYWDLRGDDGYASAEKWASTLKSWYEAGGQRPLWITEWNNGANWTGGNFPGDQEQQQQKNAEDLKRILHVLDTCSYVERYSIYNWVEDKRALVMGYDESGNWLAEGTIDQQLTAAGKVYMENQPGVAYNPDYDRVMQFRLAAPSLSVSVNQNRRVTLSWKDYNGELTKEYVIERKTNGGSYEEIYRGVPSDEGLNNSYSYEQVNEEFARYTYRIKVTSLLNENETLYSNEAILEIGAVQGTGNIRYGVNSLSDNEWKYFFYNTSYEETPAVFSTGFTYNNSSLCMTYTLSSLTKDYFRFQVTPWGYESEGLYRQEDMSYIVASHGNYSWGDLPVEIGNVQRIGADWVSVTFNRPFEEVPVILVSPGTYRNTFPIAPRVRNVTKSGFEVRLTKKRGEENTFGAETINYLAVTPGTTTVNGKKLKVGRIDEIGELSQRQTIEFGETFSHPVFYAALQSSNDELTYGVRYRQLTSEEVVVFKQQEKSKGSSSSIALDTMGWIVIEGDERTSVNEVKKDNAPFFYPTVTSGTIWLNTEAGTKVTVYNVNGTIVKMITCSGKDTLYVDELPDGVYILQTDTGNVQRFIKTSK